MASVGPEIPAYLLQQRSATPDDDGPMPGPSIGPALPPQATAPPPGHDEDADEDDYVPMLPPDLVARKAAPSAPASSSTARRVVGPAMPPGFAPAQREVDSESDEEGPMPLPAGVGPVQKDAVAEFMEREERRRKAAEDALKPKKLERDEWMLRPPEASDLLSTLDPTKLNRPRRFNASSKSATASKKTDHSLWTETPAERQQRLADEISGKRRRAENADAVDTEEAAARAKKARRDANIRKGVDDYTRTHRGDTLLSSHAAREADKPKDPEEFKALWDRDRDMGSGGRLMDEKTRSRIIKDSAGLKDRFGTGSAGGFL